MTVPATQPAGPVALEARVYDEKTFVPVQPADGTPRLSVPSGRADGGLAPGDLWMRVSCSSPIHCR